MKFYPADWRSDPALRSCTIAARGLWIEMLALMHEAEPYGSLLVNGQRVDKKRLAALAGVQERECVVLLLELEGVGVFSRDDDGTIYSRRMRRDAARSEEGRKQIAKRWKDRAPNRSDDSNPSTEPITQKPEARSQTEASASVSAHKRGARLPDGWSPGVEDWDSACDKLGQIDARNELAKFRDYWKAQPGQRGVKLDWEATFRNWIRNARGAQNHGKPKNPIIQAADDLCRKLASFDGPQRNPDELRGEPREAPPRLLSHG